MHVVAIDPQEHSAVLAPDDLVRRPQLVDKGLRLAHAGSMCLRLLRWRMSFSENR